MAKVLSISSQAVHGQIGNSITAFVLQRLGHEVLALPSVLLSNRPGYASIAARPVASEDADAILNALMANGWFEDLDAVVTGYLPSRAHADLCHKWIVKLKTGRSRLCYICDPIAGDDPGGLYIERDTALAVRDLALRLADIVTPNRFELGWLSDRPVHDFDAVIAAGQALARPCTVVTSAPGAVPGTIRNMLLEGGAVIFSEVKRRDVKAHGTGDFFTSVFAACKLSGANGEQALKAATGATELLLEATGDRPELALVATQDVWQAAADAWQSL